MNRLFHDRIKFLSYIMLGIFVGTSSAQNAISTSVLSAAGGTAQADSFALTGTVGQLTHTGRTASSRFALSGGFIYNATNSAPVVANTVPSQRLTVGGNSFKRDLNASPPIFVDRDEDRLTYTAHSNAANVATASVLGNMLTVAPEGLGEAEITVIARDGRGGEDSTAFVVKVETVDTPNRAPTVIGPLPDQMLRE